MFFKKLIFFVSLTLLSACSSGDNKKESNVEISIELEGDSLSTEVSDLNNSDNLTSVDVRLFTIFDIEPVNGQKVGFVSLSDIYVLSDHKDSLAIPQLDNLNESDSVKYFELENEFRDRFFERTGVSSSDSLFLYDYESDVLLSFPVKELIVAANLSVYDYASTEDDPYNQHCYEIGFSIDKSYLTEVKGGEPLVFIGNENPFVFAGITAIKWKEIKDEEFPLGESNILYKLDGEISAESYVFSSEEYDFYLQDRIYTENRQVRHLIVLKDESLYFERIFRESEGASFVPVGENSRPGNQQWTGKLLKNQPEVIFGFEYFSFGCPNLIFMDLDYEDIYLKCDNRH